MNKTFTILNFSSLIFVSSQFISSAMSLNVEHVEKNTYLEHPVKVLDLEVWRQLELVADVVAALSGVGDIDGEDERLVAERLHAVYDLF